MKIIITYTAFDKDKKAIEDFTMEKFQDAPSVLEVKEEMKRLYKNKARSFEIKDCKIE